MRVITSVSMERFGVVLLACRFGWIAHLAYKLESSSVEGANTVLLLFACWLPCSSVLCLVATFYHRQFIESLKTSVSFARVATVLIGYSTLVFWMLCGPLMIGAGALVIIHQLGFGAELAQYARGHAWLGGMLIMAMAVSSATLVLGLLLLTQVAFLALAILHWIFWPVLERPLYSLARHGLLSDRRVTLAYGISLIGLGVAPFAQWVFAARH